MPGLPGSCSTPSARALSSSCFSSSPCSRSQLDWTSEPDFVGAGQGLLRHDSEIERLRLPIGAHLGIVAENEAEHERTRRAITTGEPLPAGGVVEVPCLVDGTGTRPTRIGALPPQLAALSRTYLSVDDLVVRAAVEDDPHHIRHAAMTDPATLPVPKIFELCDDLVRVHGDRLQPALRTVLGA